MKKIKFLTLSLLALSSVFLSCGKEKPNPPLDDIVEDGFYVTGEATASSKLISKSIMASGFNEAAENAARPGMYEKYIALEQGKDFYLLLKEGKKETKYGAELTEVDLTNNEIDNPKVKLLKGDLKENGTLKVAKSGLYHIVLDLNKDNLLSAPQIVISAVEWGIRGAMNGWGFTAFETGEFNKEKIEFTLKEQAISSSQEFKFGYGHGWKIDLDSEGKVKANANIGKDQKPGGDNIKIDKTAIYTVKLTWSLASGAIANSYKVEYVETAASDAINYANCELEIVGDGVDETNTNASKDTSDWNWGYTLSAGKPTVEGDVYTWTWEEVVLKTQGFKIRTVGFKPSGDVPAFEAGHGVVNAEKSPDVEDDNGNIKVKTIDTYKIVLTINSETEAREAVITKK